MKNFKLYLLLLAAVLPLAACGGNKVVAGPIANNAPEWVNKGSGAFADGGVSAFYGVGVVQNVRDKALAMEASDTRARAAVAKTLDSYISALTKSYQASTSAGDPAKISEEQNITSTMKALTDISLRGAVIVDRWQDPTDKTMFALARLDLEKFKAALDQANQLDAKVRDYVRANSDKAFTDLNDAVKAKAGN